MDKEKVFNELLERLTQSAYYYGVHKSIRWKEVLENDKKAIKDFFKKQTEQLERDKMMLANIVTADFKPAVKDHPYGKPISRKLIL